MSHIPAITNNPFAGPVYHPPQPPLFGHSTLRSRVDAVRFASAMAIGADTVAFTRESQAMPTMELKSLWRRIWDNITSLWDNLKFFGAIVIATVLPIKPLRKYIERQFLYFPPRHVALDDLQSAALKTKIKDVYFNSADGTRLHGWYIPADPRKKKPTIIYAHGRHRNVADSEAVMKAFTDRGYGVFSFDYRGFGNSDGKPDEAGLYRDLEAASRFIAEYPDPKHRVPVTNQILAGNSLGGGVVLDVARKFPFKAVIAASTFTTLKDALTHCKSRYNGFIKWLFNENIITAKFNSIDKIAEIKSPLLITTGDMDDVTPVFMSKALFEKATAQHKVFLPVEGCNHHGLFSGAADKVMDALDQLLSAAYPAKEKKAS